MSNLTETIDYKGMSIKIYYDEDAESPAGWDNPDCFLCSDYRDLHVHSECLSASDCREVIERTGRWFSGRSNHACKTNGFYIFPVSIYDHSGIALSLGTCHGWDYTNGHAFVCVNRQKGWSWAKSKARKVAEDLLNTWNEYLSGEVYGFVAEDSDGNEIDSCWGYFGDDGVKQAISEAKSAIDYELRERAEAERKTREAILAAHLAKRKAQIKAHAPLMYRTAFTY